MTDNFVVSIEVRRTSDIAEDLTTKSLLAHPHAPNGREGRPSTVALPQKQQDSKESARLIEFIHDTTAMNARAIISWKNIDKLG